MHSSPFFFQFILFGNSWDIRFFLSFIKSSFQMKNIRFFFCFFIFNRSLKVHVSSNFKIRVHTGKKIWKLGNLRFVDDTSQINTVDDITPNIRNARFIKNGITFQFKTRISICGINKSFHAWNSINCLIIVFLRNQESGVNCSWGFYIKKSPRGCLIDEFLWNLWKYRNSEVSIHFLSFFLN